MKTKIKKKKRLLPAFTLLEVLLVVAIIAILAGIVILALNPTKQLGDSRNSRRRSDVATIMNAVYQFVIDNNGNFPSVLPVSTSGTASILGTETGNCGSYCTATTTENDCIDLTSDLVSDFLVSIPQDPTTGAASATDYFILRAPTSGRITVGACDPEQGATIEISR